MGIEDLDHLAKSASERDRRSLLYTTTISIIPWVRSSSNRCNRLTIHH